MTYILYPKERQILEFISQFIQRNGYAPTLAEIAESIGVSALSTVHEHLSGLVRKGFINRKPGVDRSIEIIEEKFHIRPASVSVELPVLGFIAAGSPLEPHTDPNFYMSVLSEGFWVLKN